MEKIRKVFQLDNSVRKLVYLDCFLELEDVWGVKGERVKMSLYL